MAGGDNVIYESRDIPAGKSVEADVVVVGSGAGGTVVATELVEAGRKVVVLEEGGYYPAEQLNQREDEMIARLMTRRGPEWNRDYSVTFARSKAVGGSTMCYWADSFRTPPDRIEKWAREFSLRDFTPTSLEPYFERTGVRAGIARVPDSLVNANNRRFAAAAEGLGWSAPRIERAAPGCVGSGFCDLGCAYGAKGLVFTYLPHGLRRGLEVFADCRADRFVVRDGRIAEVVASVVDRETGEPRREVRVRGKIVVVACGGLGSPYLLLKNGIRGPVGKRLYWNPHLEVYCLYDDPVCSYVGVPCAHHLDEFRLVRTGRDGSYREGGYTILCGFVQPGGLAGTVTRWGETLQRLMDRYHHVGGAVSVIDDDEPAVVRVDHKGRMVIEAWLGPRDKEKARDYLKKVSLLFLAAGAGEVYLPDNGWTTIRRPRDVAAIDRLPLEPHTITVNAAHLMGTCPMGEDPSRAAVDSYCRSHVVPNLFVTDASCLPTSVSVDPSWTIMAVAARAAHYIANRWRRLVG